MVDIFFKITNSESINKKWTELRLATGCALFFAFLTHYIFLFIAYFKVEKGINKDAINFIAKRFYLYGVAALLSVAFVQGNVYQSVLSWLTLIPFVLWHFFTQDAQYKSQEPEAKRTRGLV